MDYALMFDVLLSIVDEVPGSRTHPAETSKTEYLPIRTETWFYTLEKNCKFMISPFFGTTAWFKGCDFNPNFHIDLH